MGGCYAAFIAVIVCDFYDIYDQAAWRAGPLLMNSPAQVRVNADVEDWDEGPA
jgi:hypothetical protein